MTCARQNRLEGEAHQIGRLACMRSANRLGLTVSCADEYRCLATDQCAFFREALQHVTAFDEALP